MLIGLQEDGATPGYGRGNAMDGDDAAPVCLAYLGWSSTFNSTNVTGP